MRILLTNDDGIGLGGNLPLAQALLDAGHDVVAIGPVDERSGSGTAIGAIEHGGDIGLSQRILTTTPPVRATCLDAPPAMAVLGAIGGEFGPRPDLVVSGINPGHNVGRSVMFSGTVGAALTASTFGIPAIAISCGFEPEARYDTAALVAIAVIDWVHSSGRPAWCLNVNTPDCDVSDLTGVSLTHLAERGRFSIKFEQGENTLVIRRAFREPQTDGRTDIDALQHGRVSITPLAGITSVDHEAANDLITHLEGLWPVPGRTEAPGISVERTTR